MPVILLVSLLLLLFKSQPMLVWQMVVLRGNIGVVLRVFVKVQVQVAELLPVTTIISVKQESHVIVVIVPTVEQMTRIDVA